MHSDYLTLRNMGKASRVLMENRKDLGAYLGLLDFVKENNIKVRDLNHAVDLAQNIHNLKQEKAQLEFDIDTLMDTKKWYEKELDDTKRQVLQNPLSTLHLPHSKAAECISLRIPGLDSFHH